MPQLIGPIGTAITVTEERTTVARMALNLIINRIGTITTGIMAGTNSTVNRMKPE